MEDILLTKDNDTFTEWIQNKKDTQALRVSVRNASSPYAEGTNKIWFVQHAQHCQFWLYRLYRTWHRPQQSNHYEKIIAVILLLLLAFLRRDRIMSTFLWVGTPRLSMKDSPFGHVIRRPKTTPFFFSYQIGERRSLRCYENTDFLLLLGRRIDTAWGIVMNDNAKSELSSIYAPYLEHWTSFHCTMLSMNFVLKL